MPPRRSQILVGICWLALASLIEGSLLWLLRSGDPRLHVVETIAVLLTTSLFYILSVWLLLRMEVAGYKFPPALTLGAAIVFRLTAFGLPPALSDDLYRYRWEGKIQTYGFNPYTAAPDSDRLRAVRDVTYPRIGNPQLPAVYGPLIELEQRFAFRLVSVLTGDAMREVFWMKLVSAGADLAVIAALFALLIRVRGDGSRVLIYAWNPLVTFEFWATGHHDSLVVGFVLLALLLARRGGWIGASVALGAAAAAKFWPVLLLPILTGWNRRRLLTAGAIVASFCILLLLPYRADLMTNARVTSGFLGGWRNNDSLHGLIAALTPNPYAAKYVTAALIVGAAFGISRLRWQNEAKVLAVIVTILLLSANVHPWYLTWFIPLLTLYPITALLLWTALAPLSYAAAIEWTTLGVWNGTTAWRWWIYGPVLGVALLSVARRKRA